LSNANVDAKCCQEGVRKAIFLSLRVRVGPLARSVTMMTQGEVSRGDSEFLPRRWWWCFEGWLAGSPEVRLAVVLCCAGGPGPPSAQRTNHGAPAVGTHAGLPPTARSNGGEAKQYTPHTHKATAHRGPSPRIGRERKMMLDLPALRATPCCQTSGCCSGGGVQCCELMVLGKHYLLQKSWRAKEVGDA
jgi:hypothetical protein